MDLKLSCSDYTFPLLEHDHVLDLISALGVQGVDIGLFGGRSHLRPEIVLGNIPASARNLSNRVAERGLKIATIFLIPENLDFRSLATNNPDPNQQRKARDLFQRTLEFTARCNALHLSAGAGLGWGGETINDSIRRDADELSWRVEQASSLGITFAIEPHANSLAATPETTLQLVKKAPGLTLALDYSHFTLQGIPDQAVEPLLAYTSHFHARGANPNRLQAAMKDNTIDYIRILKLLNTKGFTGFISLEYVWTEWEHCNEVDNLSETILLREHLRSIADSLT
jgi:sugar phosphate isomerase/epimerase